jgi:2-methylcitrate dehydratase PrpD
MAIKLVPGGHPYHAIAEAAGNATRESGISSEQIASITIHRPGMKMLSGPLHPADLIDMAHSPAYFAAAGAADRGFSWIHASPAKIADPVIHALIDKVSVGVEPTENLSRYRQGATVTILTRDGRTVSSTVFEPKGSATLGISWNDVDAKYRTLMPASGLPEREIELSLTLIHDFRNLSDVARLTNLLRVVTD